MSKLALGLDVSPLRIGWAVITDTNELVNHGVIIFPSKEWVTPAMRADALEDALDSYTFDMIGAEAVFVGVNRLGSIRAAMALGQVESICDYLWPDANQKILTATQWRNLCGITQGGKAPVMEWATTYCHDHDSHTPENQDAADAIAIAHATVLWFDAND